MYMTRTVIFLWCSHKCSLALGLNDGLADPDNFLQMEIHSLGKLTQKKSFKYPFWMSQLSNSDLSFDQKLYFYWKQLTVHRKVVTFCGEVFLKTNNISKKTLFCRNITTCRFYCRSCVTLYTKQSSTQQTATMFRKLVGNFDKTTVASSFNRVLYIVRRLLAMN